MKTTHTLTLTLALALCVATNAFAQRGERTIAIPRGEFSTVTIVNHSGSVEVIGSGRSDIAVPNNSSSLQRELDIDVDGTQIRIKVNTVSLVVRVPANVKLFARSGSGSVSVSGVTGPVEVETQSGQISVVGVTTTLHAVSLSGSVTADGAQERAYVESISGTVVLQRTRGIVNAQSTSGTVRVYGRDIKDAKMSSVSGSVVFEGTLARDARIEAESSSGGIELQVPNMYAADYDLTSISGHIDNEFGPSPVKSRNGNGATLRFSTGGGGRIVATTVSGSIHLQGN
jgi:DUF4097 and DUF4098 domain-containing protein YvlB